MVERVGDRGKRLHDSGITRKLNDLGLKQLKWDKFVADPSPTDEGIKLRGWALRLLDLAESQTSINELYSHYGYIADVDGGEYAEHLLDLTTNPVTGERPMFWNPGLYCREIRRIMGSLGVKESELGRFDEKVKKAKDAFGYNEVVLKGTPLDTGKNGIGPAYVISSEDYEVPIPKYTLDRKDLPKQLERLFEAGVKAASHFLSFYEHFPKDSLEELENFGMGLLGEEKDELGKSYEQATSPETLAMAEQEGSYKPCLAQYESRMYVLGLKMRERAKRMSIENAKALGATVDLSEYERGNKMVDMGHLCFSVAGRSAAVLCKGSINAEWAVEELVEDMTKVLSDSEQGVAQRESIVASMNKVFDHLMGDSPRKRLLRIYESLPEGAIPVGIDMAGIIETTTFEERISGAAFSKSSPQAHNLINLKKAEVPTLCRVGDELLKVWTGETVIVDDKDGLFIRHPDPKTIATHEARQAEKLAEEERNRRISHLPGQTIDGKRIGLYANIGPSDDLVTKVHGDVVYEGTEYTFTASNVRDIVQRVEYVGGERRLIDIYEGDIDSPIPGDLSEEDREIVDWVKRIDVNNREAAYDLARRREMDIRRWSRKSGAVGHGVEGVGLCRAEYVLRLFDSMPTPSQLEERQFDELVGIITTHSREANRNLNVFKALSPRDEDGIAHLESNAHADIVIRGFDISNDKPGPEYFIGKIGDYSKEIASNLRWMGCTDLLLKNREKLMKPQIRATLRAAHEADNKGMRVHYMLPNVLSAEQIAETLALMDEVANELEGEGIDHKMVDIIPLLEDPDMCIVKSNLQAIIDAGEGRIKRLGIGTNDMAFLAQPGIERGKSVLDPFLPAVLRSINNIAEVAHANNLEAVICGEAGGRSTFIPVFLALGVDGFSMSDVSLPTIKRVVRNLNFRLLSSRREEMIELSETDMVGLYRMSKEIADAAKERP